MLWAKRKAEHSITKTMPTCTMASQGIPAVFSFSISYHIEVISMLRVEGVQVFGCVYLHDNIIKVKAL